MASDPVGAFGGMSGRVLREAFGVESLVNGLVIGLVLAAGCVPLALAGAPNGAALYVETVIALALARFACNGLAGEWGGTLFSSRGGPLERTAVVALSYLALSAIWVIPLMLLGFRPENTMPRPGSGFPGAGDGKLVVLLLLYAFGSALTPPLFLVVAVSAERMSDLFRRETWSRVLGRREDLLTLYSVQFGAVLLAAFMAIPMLLIASVMGWKMAAFAGGLWLLFVLGLGLNLVGRLCGLFAAGAAAEEAAPAPARASDPVAAPGARAPAVRAAAAGAVPPVRGATAQRARPGAEPALAVAPGTGGGRSILLDARERVDAAFERYRTDPGGAIAYLQELRATHTPHPHVLHALACMLARSARDEEAIEVSRQALPLCFHRGHLQLAADLLVELWPRVAELGLSRDQIIQIGGALRDRGDLRNAANAFALVIQADRGEHRAVQGMLKVADAFLADRLGAEDALRLYRYLIEHCAGSALADEMRRGEAAAEKRVARA